MTQTSLPLAKDLTTKKDGGAKPISCVLTNFHRAPSKTRKSPTVETQISPCDSAMVKPLGGSIEKSVEPDSLENAVHFAPSQAEMFRLAWIAPGFVAEGRAGKDS